MKSVFKIICILVVIITSITIFYACNCDAGNISNNEPSMDNNLNELNNYKFEAINRIISYLNYKREMSFYSDIGNDRLIDIFEESIIKIQDSDNKDDIETVYFETIKKIDALVPVNSDEIKGKFYSLKDAFDNGFIRHDDLVILKELVENITPIKLEDMSPKILRAIRKNAADLYSVEIEEVYVRYFGLYNGYYAVNICLDDTGVGDREVTVNVGGVTFIYPNSSYAILIWKQLPNGRGEVI